MKEEVLRLAVELFCLLYFVMGPMYIAEMIEICYEIGKTWKTTCAKVGYGACAESWAFTIISRSAPCALAMSFEDLEIKLQLDLQRDGSEQPTLSLLNRDGVEAS